LDGFWNYQGIKTQEVSFKYFTNENTTRPERAQNNTLPAKHTARTTSLSVRLALLLLALSFSPLSRVALEPKPFFIIHLYT
jgi:hypothetical protein